MHYRFRPATNDDRPAVENLVFGVLAEYDLSPDPAGTGCDLHDIHASYHAGGGTFDLLVDDAGHVLGTVGLFRVSHSTCELARCIWPVPPGGRGWAAASSNTR